MICLHYGNLKLAWDSVILLATLYVACVVPYQAAFTDYRSCFGGHDHEIISGNQSSTHVEKTKAESSISLCSRFKKVAFFTKILTKIEFFKNLAKYVFCLHG